MTRKRFRELVSALVKSGAITSIGEFARMYHIANKLPRQPKSQG